MIRGITISELPSLRDVNIIDDIVDLLDELTFNTMTFEKGDLRRTFENPNFVLFVARCGHKVVGMGTVFYIDKFSGLSAEIHDIVLQKNYREQGIGKKIIEALVENVQNHSRRTQKNINLSLTSRPSREVANSLYIKLGFRLAARAVGKKGTNLYKMDIAP